MNSTNQLGRLTKDPELRFTANGKAVATFTLAVNRDFKQEGQPDADFFPIVVWGKTAEFVANYFKKGQLMALTGRLQTRNWEDNDGKKHYVTEIVADRVYFAGGKNEGNTGVNNTQGTSGYTQIDEEEDLPF